VDRIRAIGNGQVPAVAALAWNLLTVPAAQAGVGIAAIERDTSP